MDKLDIIEFEAFLAKHFSDLNLAWIQKYFTVEPKDEEVLSNPQDFIIDKGGYVFFAKMEDEIVGTFALLKITEGVFELSKMAVAEAKRGHKVGNKMLEFCLGKAKELNAVKVVLYSNTILEPAIYLYKKFGFREIPLENSEYMRSNIKMEIDIK